MKGKYGPEWDKLERIYGQAKEKASKYVALAKKYNALAKSITR